MKSLSRLNSARTTSTLRAASLSLPAAQQLLVPQQSVRNFARWRPKRLLQPRFKRAFIAPHTKKEHQFSLDTLETLSHGEDWVTKIRTTNFGKKLKIAKLPKNSQENSKKKKKNNKGASSVTTRIVLKRAYGAT